MKSTGIFPFGISTQSMPTRRKSDFTKFLVGKVTFSDSMCIRLEIFPWRVETDLFGLWMHVSLLKKSWLTLKNTFCQEIPYSNPKKPGMKTNLLWLNFLRNRQSMFLLAPWMYSWAVDHTVHDHFMFIQVFSVCKKAKRAYHLSHL